MSHLQNAKPIIKDDRYIFDQQREQAFINHILSHINDMIFVADEQHRFVYVTDTVIKKYGYTREELLNMSIGDLDINFTGMIGESQSLDFLKQKNFLDFYNVHRDASGKLHPVWIRAHYVEYEGRAYNFGIVEDESYIQRLIDVQDGFVILTNGKKVVMINQHFLDFLGYKTFILFTQQHDCVCDYFINEPDFIHKTDNWIEDITNSLHNDAKVKMNNIQTGGEHIFLIRASSFDETRFIITFTDITEIETYKKILENQALTDGLTSLFNRRYFNKILPREISRANRENKKFVFMMLDIDNFKQYNDIYGHQAGDDALIQVAHTIQKSFNRGSDYAFRLGGEEFGVIFSFETLHATQNKIEQLRTNIENLQIEHNASTVSSFITVSIGAVVSDGTESLETLYALADERLYQAKRNGKNRFIY